MYGKETILRHNIELKMSVKVADKDISGLLFFPWKSTGTLW